MKYIAHTQKSEQVTEASWKLVTYALELDENTTIREIQDWVHRIHQVNEQRKKTFRLDVTILQVDEKPNNHNHEQT